MATPNRVATGGTASLFAYQNTPLIIRLWNFFTGIFEFDNVNYVEEDIADRGLTFTLHDPAYGGEKFSPAILGSGTYHKYLLYFDNRFPFIHQNFLTIHLGTSYSVNKGVDAFETMVQPQGNYVRSTTYYPTGAVQESADDLHSATYLAGSRELNLVYADLYNDDYTNVSLVKDSGSRMYYSFIVSIIASALAYMIGLPLGILMAKRKDTWVDSLGNAYVVLIMAVPGLAYMLMLKAVGNKLGLPTTFSLDNPTWLMYIMPIAASAISAIAGEMTLDAALHGGPDELRLRQVRPQRGPERAGDLHQAHLQERGHTDSPRHPRRDNRRALRRDNHGAGLPHPRRRRAAGAGHRRLRQRRHRRRGAVLRDTVHHLRHHGRHTHGGHGPAYLLHIQSEVI